MKLFRTWFLKNHSRQGRIINRNGFAVRANFASSRRVPHFIWLRITKIKWQRLIGNIIALTNGYLTKRLIRIRIKPLVSANHFFKRFLNAGQLT